MHPETMDDYSALAQRIAVSVQRVRGCLVLSRDGLVLGAFPDDDETTAKPAWVRFCALGEPEKSFIEYPDQTWAYVRRGPYSAFAVAEAGVRPGILIDQLEQALLTVEESRAKRETYKVPEAASAPSGKPRSSLHPPADKPEPVQVQAKPEQRREAGAPTIAGSTGDATPPQREGSERADGTPPPKDEDETPRDAAEVEEPVTAEPGETPATSLKREPQKLAGEVDDADEETEVDRVLLAKEFSGLLQVHKDDDEGSS
jgi:hypothetical protein